MWSKIDRVRVGLLVRVRVGVKVRVRVRDGQLVRFRIKIDVKMYKLPMLC